jgi:glyoxylase-like metal-dependent hydrolase (beta-lactamase superfamily II)
VIFRQILYRDLGCASYLLGDAGQAVVVDPRWDIDVYLAIAATERLTIVEVLDTHDHADHVSGRLRLATATGARSRRPASGDAAAGVIVRGRRDPPRRTADPGRRYSRSPSRAPRLCGL